MKKTDGSKATKLRRYREGGMPTEDQPPSTDVPGPAKNRSWEPGRKGQGGEGLSSGYGGSGGDGTGPSGPDEQNDETNQ